MTIRGFGGIAVALLGAVVLLGSVAPAMAQRHDERRDSHGFRERDHERWRGGHWEHAEHGGRFGWYWTVGPERYYYTAPVYPYPDPYVPPVVAAPVPGPSAQYWYYCQNPPGYYPYVGQCYGSWEAVPAR